jgi:prepilin-type N-terminal cleavage/methylation domain-containing protein
MKKEQGFSLIELLIVVAIIAIIAAIAVPSMLTARMAANESSATQGCRTIGSAMMAFASVNNQMFAEISTLVTEGYLDSRFDAGNGFNGYHYEEEALVGVTAAWNAIFTEGAPNTFAVQAKPIVPDSTGRYNYGIATDQVVRYQGPAGDAKDPGGLAEGEPIGQQKSGASAG